MITTNSYPRAALIGNPSDGYFGKTIAFIFKNFNSSVTLEPSEQIRIIPSELDQNEYESIKQLHYSITQYGYYGGVRLIKASLKRFYDYAMSNKYPLKQNNFSVSYHSNIPNRLGLAGSSAIITACFKALCKWNDLYISPEIMANLVLSVETDELGISAGLQDRVAQSFEHPIFMDFDKSIMDKQGYGNYIPVSLDVIKDNIYIAYRESSTEGSEVTHNELSKRYNNKEKEVIDAMNNWSELSEQFLTALSQSDLSAIGQLINANFDLRKNLFPISNINLEMINLARSTGASAKFTGSGGAMIGTFKDEKMYKHLKLKLNEKDIRVLKPEIITTDDY